MATLSTSVDTLRAALSAAEPGALPVMAEYERDPVGFTENVLGLSLTPYQKSVLVYVAAWGRVAWRSGHKVGKSTVMACLALWWVCTHIGARVVLFAPTARQIRSILWREIRRLHRKAVVPIGGELFDVPDRGLQFPDGREVIGFATDQPERMAGISGPAMLFLGDESSGVTEDLFAAIAGNLAGGGKLVLCGNPTRTSGTFYDAFTRKAEFYKQAHTSSLESPNCIGGTPVPGLATPEWCAEMLAEWGRESPLYQVRVLGEFPSQAENAVIPLELVEAAVARWRDLAQTEAIGALEFGLDPARFGDDESVLVPRRGLKAFEPIAFRNLDGIQLAARVIEVANRLRRADERPVVRVDVIGIGASVYDQLKQNSSIRTIAVNVGEASTNANHARKRDEVWFTLRDWLKDGGAIPDDVKLQGELVAPTYSFDVRGKIKVESKDDMKARLKRSPDRADALALAVYTPRNDFTRNFIEAMRRLAAGDVPSYFKSPALYRKDG